MEQFTLPEETVQPSETNTEAKKKPLGFTLLLIFGLVFNGILFLFTVSGLFYIDIIHEILVQYYPESLIGKHTALLVDLSGVLMSGLSVLGLILMWLYRRIGYYFYVSSQSAMIITLVFALRSYDIVNIAISMVIMIIFGLYVKEMR